MRKNKSFFIRNELAISIVMRYSLAAMEIIKGNAYVEYKFGTHQSLTRMKLSRTCEVFFMFPIAKYEYATLWIDRKQAAKMLRKVREVHKSSV
jgi:hypothetical protein